MVETIDEQLDRMETGFRKKQGPYKPLIAPKRGRGRGNYNNTGNRGPSYNQRPNYNRQEGGFKFKGEIQGDFKYNPSRGRGRGYYSNRGRGGRQYQKQGQGTGRGGNSQYAQRGQKPRFDKSPTKRKPRTNSKTIDKDKNRCYHCRSPDHYINECPDLVEKQNKTEEYELLHENDQENAEYAGLQGQPCSNILFGMHEEPIPQTNQVHLN